MKHYIVAAVGEWNHQNFIIRAENKEGHWHYCNTPDELHNLLKQISPRYIFFPHWRWLVPEEITSVYECICFHMTDVPYGRGGSPLQNLIIRGHKKTQLTALKMVNEADAGPVYYKEALDLNGPAHEIYQKSSHLCWELIDRIIQESPVPEEQSGKVTLFTRRTPEQSQLPEQLDSESLYDFIRMLDAEGYPHAFLETESYRLELTDGQIDQDGNVSARVTFKARL